MRSLVLLLALVASLASAHKIMTKAMDDIRFGDDIAYNLYNGFVRGLYKSQEKEVISTQCFGEWI